ncbi:uncharacterized protein TRIADDRAFT_59766 [Trichoplax adhaerens]|uniref:Actin-related protein 10 n=1 Tax=Trichoplax adhaerens TaxID=10228 RepID=B3S6D4_TRIAD|nr:hypothetical protein TRIADDRAFT_59766 [Trichoplax adhaerens]EDV21739.1 hypothetical protein TRIADDRAFT_59766 [Trichoplax adhaerens]|eukprot:XP_002115887.1 hypothetical protein TRIADDRAFT_59766 [Trichoplax adhaerens]
MSLLDNIVLGSEKVPVVLDIGAAYTKCGFAGESCPRHILPSSVVTCVDGKEKVVKFIDYAGNSQELVKLLKRFIHNIFFKYLLVNPKDRRMVIVESVLCPNTFKNSLAKVIFQHFEIQSAMFAPGHLMGLYSLGLTTAMIVDCGYSEAIVLPFYETASLFNCCQVSNLAGKVINSHLEKLLLLYASITYGNETKPFAAERGPLTEDILEEIKVKACVSGHNPNYEDNASESTIKPLPAKPMKFHLGPSKVLTIPGEVRDKMLDAVFKPDCNDISLASMIIDCLLMCPIDIRKDLAASICVTGGCAAIPGFNWRLKEELTVLANSPRYKDELCVKTFKFYETVVHPNYTNWLGGSICGILENLPDRSISRETFLKAEYVPDWTHSRKRLRSVAQAIMKKVSGEKTPSLASVVSKIMTSSAKAKLPKVAINDDS